MNCFGLLTVAAADPATTAAVFARAYATPENSSFSISVINNCNVSSSYSSDSELVSAFAGAPVGRAGSENGAACGSSTNGTNSPSFSLYL